MRSSGPFGAAQKSTFGLSSRWRQRATVVGIAATALLAVDVTAADAGALVMPPQATVVAAKAAAVPVLEAADLVSARVAARAQGARVEAVSERTEEATTWVNPDGTLTTDLAGAPVRVKDAAGAWQPVDLNLQNTGGVVMPKRMALDLRLSAGGASTGGGVTDLVSADHGTGRSVTWAWKKSSLPRPVLAGSVATYPAVLAGVDLRISVRPRGFEQDFLIKDRAAADAVAVAGGSFTIPLKTKGLTARATADGGVEFLNAKGKQVSLIAPPDSWDAALDPRSGEHLARTKVALTVAQTDAKNATLTVKPDPAWLADPARVFPVTIDPTYAAKSFAPTFDTWVATNYNFPNNDMSQDPELKAGTYDGGTTKAASYLNVNISNFKGLAVKSAQLNLWETHSFSCTAKPLNLHSSTAVSTSTRWSNAPPPVTLGGSVTAAKGFSSSCAAGWIAVPMTGLAQSWSTSTSTVGTVRLSASDTDSYGWKRFSSSEGAHAPTFSLTYNRAPNTPTAPTFSAGAQTYGGQWYASSLTPTITSKATDPDGNAVKLTTEITTSASAGAAVVTSCTTATVASGASGTCVLPAGKLVDNTTYYMRAKAQDDQGLYNATYSSFTKFYTAKATPAGATISCPTGYSNGAWVDSPAASTVNCTVTTATPTVPSSPGVLHWRVDGGGERLAGSWPQTATVTVDAAHSGTHIISAYTRSKAGVLSAVSTYSFGTGGVAMSYPAANKTTTATGPMKIQMSGPPKGTASTVTGKLKWRLAGSNLNATTGWYVDPLAVPVALTGPGGGAVVTTSWDVSKADIDPGTAGLQPDPRTPVKLDVQICLTYTGATTVEKCTWATAPSSVLRVPHAFGNGFPTTDAGPGQVALFTGEFNTSATDVTVPGYTGSLSLSRSHATYGNLPSAYIPPAAAVFGPGWTASLDGSDAGLGQLVPYDGTRDDGTIAFIDEDGTALVYQANTAGARRTTADLTPGTWVATDDDTKLSGTTLKVAGTGLSTVLTLTEIDGTKTTFVPAGPAFVPTLTGPGRFTVKTVIEATGSTTTTSTDPSTGRVTRILAPVPAGMTAADCPDPTTPDLATLKPGCRALRLTYAATTSGTQVAGQLSAVNLQIWSPTDLATTDCAGTATTLTRTASGFISVPVACYGYNPAKQLATVKDPRNGLTTSYTYGTSNQLLTVTPPGTPGNLKPYTIGYTTTASNQLQVTSVSRTNPADTGTSTLARIVYKPAPSVSNAVTGSQLPDLTAGNVTSWGQAVAPAAAAAVFGPDYTGPISGTGIDWRYADLSYTDPQGYTTNTASYGAGRWLYDYTKYDELGLGNVVFTLDQDATATILDAKAAGTPVTNITGLGTTTIYNAAATGATPAAGLPANTPAGAIVTDVYSPARTVTLPDGTSRLVRPRTHTDYDQGAPNGGLNPATAAAGATAAEQKGYALATTATTYAADSIENVPPASTTAPVIARKISGYAPKSGAPATTSGWVLGAATTSTTDMDLSGTVNAGDITAATYYDDLGRTIESRQPTSTGTDAGTTLTGYYTVAAQTGAFAACGEKPQWAGLTCRTTPAAQAAGQSIPDEATTGYSYLLAPTDVVEQSGAVTRTTTTAYLPDGRVADTGQTVTGLASSTPRDRSYSSYDPHTGALTSTETKDGSGAVTGSVASTYDGWGRTLSTTTATANGPTDAGTTTYDAAGRVATVTDAKGITSYTYDGLATYADGTQKLERRGKTTKVTVTRTGTSQAAGNLLTYTGGYDTAGNLATQSMPGGLRQNLTYDQAGQLTAMAYTGQVTPYTETTDPDTGQVTYTPGTPGTGVWLSWSQDRDTTGRVVREYNSDGAAFTGLPGVTDPNNVTAPSAGRALAADTLYSYDQAGRLSTVHDRRAAATGDTIDPGTDPDPANPCTVRGYTFDGNGNRTNLTTATHADGDCAGTPTASTTTSTSGYDTADRPTTGGTTGGAGGGSYVYDELGRQTTLPAADAPDPAQGEITLGYYDNDLPRVITQDDGTTATTTYGLDSADRRLTSVTGPTGVAAGQPGTSTTTRHYTDSGDNPTWTDTTTVPAGGGNPVLATTRYTQTLTGDLGAQIDDTTGSSAQGTATLSLANPHGDIITTVTIPAGTIETTPAVTIGPWAGYTEYGAPAPGTDAATLNSTGGAIGYGWLGAKQRSTPTEAAGLTLMGVRLYNNARGLFSAVDPVPGGNSTAYAYPQDPINGYDLDGKCWGWGCEAIASAAKSAWNSTGTASRWLTNSRVGKLIHTGCSYAWGALGAACSVTYTAAYARQGRWGEAGAEAASFIVGGQAARLIKRGYSRIRWTGNVSRHTIRRVRRVVHYNAQFHGVFASHIVGSVYSQHSRKYRRSMKEYY